MVTKTQEYYGSTESEKSPEIISRSGIDPSCSLSVATELWPERKSRQRQATRRRRKSKNPINILRKVIRVGSHRITRRNNRQTRRRSSQHLFCCCICFFSRFGFGFVIDFPGYRRAGNASVSRVSVRFRDRKREKRRLLMVLQRRVENRERRRVRVGERKWRRVEDTTAVKVGRIENLIVSLVTVCELAGRRNRSIGR